MRVVLAGGGTAGHIEPALAIAAELEKQGLSSKSEIYFVGGYRGLEGRLVPAHGYQLHQFNIIGLPRTLNFQLLTYPIRLLIVMVQMLKLFRKIKPDFVMGFGGYVAAPSYIAARILGISIVIHESNARAGVSNRRAAKHAALVIESFKGSLPNAKLLGTPIRSSIAVLNSTESNYVAKSHFSLPATGATVLVFGGSQGAERINQAIVEIAPKLSEQGIHVLHIVGELNLTKYQGISVMGAGKYIVLGYCDRMDLAYAAADLAVTRSGALTVAELAAAGMPAILVPYPVGNGEQEFNAAELVASGAAVMLRNQDCTATKLKLMIETLIVDNVKLAQMRRISKSIARPNSASLIVAELQQVVL